MGATAARRRSRASRLPGAPRVEARRGSGSRPPGLGRRTAQARPIARRPLPAEPSPDTRRQLPSKLRRPRAMTAPGTWAGGRSRSRRRAQGAPPLARVRATQHRLALLRGRFREPAWGGALGCPARSFACAGPRVPPPSSRRALREAGVAGLGSGRRPGGTGACSSLRVSGKQASKLYVRCPDLGAPPPQH